MHPCLVVCHAESRVRAESYVISTSRRRFFLKLSRGPGRKRRICHTLHTGLTQEMLRRRHNRRWCRADPNTALVARNRGRLQQAIEVSNAVFKRRPKNWILESS